MKLHNQSISYSVLLLASIAVIVPFLYAIVISLSGKGVADYSYILGKSSFFVNFGNSVLIAAACLVGISALSTLGAYAFSKLDFPFRHGFYIFFLCMLMFPPAMILVPLFQINLKLGLINSYLAVIGPYIALFAPFNLLNAKNFYDGLPDELMDAAVIDGCSSLRTFRSIVLPLSGPVIVVNVVWVFITVWNEYLLAMIFLQDLAMQTLTVLPTQFLQAYRSDIPKMFAALILMMVPVFIVYFFLQKYISKGMTAGAVKG